MTLRDLLSVTCFQDIRSITALAFFKSTKEYYSFRTLYYSRYEYEECVKQKNYGFPENLLELKVKSIRCYENQMDIDLVEWIDDTDEEES